MLKYEKLYFRDTYNQGLYHISSRSGHALAKSDACPRALYFEKKKKKNKISAGRAGSVIPSVCPSEANFKNINGSRPIFGMYTQLLILRTMDLSEKCHDPYLLRYFEVLSTF